MDILMLCIWCYFFELLVDLLGSVFSLSSCYYIASWIIAEFWRLCWNNRSEILYKFVVSTLVDIPASEFFKVVPGNSYHLPHHISKAILYLLDFLCTFLAQNLLWIQMGTSSLQNQGIVLSQLVEKLWRVHN